MTVTPTDVDNMAGQVQSALWGPGGVRSLIAADPVRAAAMDATKFVVELEPSARDRQLAGVQPGQHLLGLYTSPPSRIQLFASDIIAVGYDPVDVAVHELGHVFDYDHGAHCPECLVPKEAKPYTHRSDCPVCALHEHTAQAMALMDGLRLRSFLEHVVPAGLGGTIPEARWHLQQAASSVPAAAALVNDPGKMARLGSALDVAQASLSGWLSVEQITPAYTACRVAWDAAYDINHSFWAGRH